MGKGKPRTATHRKTNQWLAESGSLPIQCYWWDNGYPECDYPWCGKGEKDCQGNPFVCKKLLYKYLASSKKIVQTVKINFNL